MPFVTHHPWTPIRPHILVVACSDGRLQMATDEFLGERLQIKTYDRLYLPGGPGALASGSHETDRIGQARSELRFLARAHQIEELIFIFHGPSANGPLDALCADYVRSMGCQRQDLIRERQLQDAQDVLREASAYKGIRAQAFYCEVEEDFSTEFLPIR